MPGLLRGMARTAVVAGTATAVSNNVSRRQARRWSEDQPNDQSAVQSPPQPQEDPYAEIERLADLKNNGILTQEEFDSKKKQILGI